MSKYIDLTGQRFGRLLVLERVEVDKKGGYFLCQCDCGNKKVIMGSNLRLGKIKSCGCLLSESSSKTAVEKITSILEKERSDDGTLNARKSNKTTGLRCIFFDSFNNSYIVQIVRHGKTYKEYFKKIGVAQEAKEIVLQRYLSGDENWNRKVEGSKVSKKFKDFSEVKVKDLPTMKRLIVYISEFNAEHNRNIIVLNTDYLNRTIGSFLHNPYDIKFPKLFWFSIKYEFVRLEPWFGEANRDITALRHKVLDELNEKFVETRKARYGDK